jgi:hypothetical protein
MPGIGSPEPSLIGHPKVVPSSDPSSRTSRMRQHIARIDEDTTRSGAHDDAITRSVALSAQRGGDPRI